MKRILAFLKSPYFPIFMIVFVDVLGLGIVIPVLPLFAENQLNAVAGQITGLTSLYFAAQFFAGPVLGRLSDRFGRRPVLVFSQIGTLAAHLITGGAAGIGFLYVARVIDGVTGGNVSVAQAYLSDITEEKDRARGLGVVNAAFGLGFVFGPAFGSLVASVYGPRMPFFAAAAVSLCTILLCIFLLPESLPPERRQREQIAAAAFRAEAPGPQFLRGLHVLRVPAVALLLVVAFVTQFAFFSFQTVFVLWAADLVFPNLSQTLVQQAVGGVLTLAGICGIITQFWLVGPLVRRFGEKAMVAGGNLGRAFAFGLMGLSPTVAATLIGTPLLSVGGGVSLPALIALLTYAAPPGERGQVIGLYQSAAAIGSVAGPLLAGYLYERVNPDAPIFAAAVLMLVAGLLALQVFRMPLASDRSPRPA